MRSLGHLKSILLCAFVAVGVNASAFEPIRDPAKLWEAKKEQVVGITSARVVLADYALIRKDFPEVRQFSNDAIDQWLLRNTAFVSPEQAAQTVVNDPIYTSNERRSAFRPREYRRAHVFQVDTGGLIDAKGTGAVDPAGGSHDNGLATLGDMIREYAYEKLIHALFMKDGNFDTVGSYAVLDYGFSIKHPNGGRSRAGTILRQAHERYHEGPIGNRTRGQSVMLPRPLQLKIELFLRRFGITSAVKFMGKDLLNLQGAKNGAVIDFGSFLTEEKFSNPMAYFYDTNGNSAPELIAQPGDAGFVQPDPNMRIPFKIWGYSQSGRADSKYDNPYIWSHELAESLAEGKATRADVEQHIRNLFDSESVQRVLRARVVNGLCRKLFDPVLPPPRELADPSENVLVVAKPAPVKPPVVEEVATQAPAPAEVQLPTSSAGDSSLAPQNGGSFRRLWQKLKGW